MKATPRSLWFSDDNVARSPAPSPDTLRRLFRRKATRKQRHEDRTISLEGVRYQLPELVRGDDTITVAYATWNRDLVSIIDPSTEKELIDIFPVDRAENSMRRSRPKGTIRSDDDSDVEESSSETETPVDLPPFLRHLLEGHRQKWGPGVLERPESRPFKETQEQEIKE